MRFTLYSMMYPRPRGTFGASCILCFGFCAAFVYELPFSLVVCYSLLQPSHEELLVHTHRAKEKGRRK